MSGGVQRSTLGPSVAELSPISFPQDYEFSTSWQRAQTERDSGSWINDAEKMVWLEESSSPSRVVFVLCDRTLRTNCDCAGYHYDDWCAHVASCWWGWINRDLFVSHLQTGKRYAHPPDWLRVQFDGEPRSYDGLTSAELDAYLHVDLGEYGVTEYADHTDRRKGTIGNLLSRAREKAGGQR